MGTLKQVTVEDVNHIGNGVALIVRNCADDIIVGDLIGSERVVRIEAYGKILDTLPSGWTGALFFEKMPVLKAFGQQH